MNNQVKERLASWNRPRNRFILLLVLSFLGVWIPGIPGLPWGSGLATSVWIFCELTLAVEFTSTRQRIITAAVLVAGYLLRFSAAVGIAWLYLLLFPLMGLLLYFIFLLYSLLLAQWNRLPVTLVFPIFWMAFYLIAVLFRVPTLLRVDVLFSDLSILLQAESILSSFGFSFVLLWIQSLIHFAIQNRRASPALIATGIYLVLAGFGILHLAPNYAEPDTVRVAYTTGPYVGDYINYTTKSVETYLASMERSVRTAAEQGAAILVFNEEAFEVTDAEKPAFLEACGEAARAGNIHLLVGLDVSDTDRSENGKSLNEVVLIDSTGEVLDTYVKTKTIPTLESHYRPGDGDIPSHTITVGDHDVTFSCVICYDSNFPQFISNMNPETDILLLPSWDWRAVTALHARLCCALAAENRVTILKCTYDGISVAVNPDGSVFHQTDTKNTGFESVQIVDLPLYGDAETVPLTMPETPYIYGIIAVDALSVLLCLVLLYANLFETREKSSRYRVFSIMMISLVFALASDGLSWLLDGRPRLTTVLIGSSVLSLIMTFIILGEFAAYLTEYIRERQWISSLFLHIFMAYSVVASAITLALCICGTMFTFENGVFVTGPAYGVYVVANIFTLLGSVLILFLYRKTLTRHDIYAASFFSTLPAIAALINLFVPEFTYAYPAATLSIAILYVMMQADRVVQLRRDEQLSSHHASHDELTGLLNRRAYDKRLAALSEEDGMIGVIFADVNGLKYANDNFGHKAGDELLIRFATLLSEKFRKEEIFRISGDEFTVIMSQLEQPPFSQRVTALEHSLTMSDGTQIASIGVEFGNSRDVHQLLRAAEAQMYVRKDEYHKQHPEMTRI